MQESRRDLRVAQRTGKCIVWLRFFRNTAVIENGVEVKCAAAVLWVYRRLLPSLDDMHPAERVRIDGAVCEIPREPLASRRRSNKISVKRNVLPGECTVFHVLTPLEKRAHELPFRLFGRVGDLFSRKAIDCQSAVHDIGPCPNPTLTIKAILRMFKIHCTDRNNRVQVVLCPRGLNIEN